MNDLKHTILLILGALTMVTMTVRAQTDISGLIETTVWTADNSPYRVTGAIVVQEDNTLTIEAGVDVLFDADVQFVVEGAVHAHGTEADSVRFLKGNADQWRGIRITNSDTSSFAYTRISDGYARGPSPQDYGGGLYIGDSSTRLSIDNSVIRENAADGDGGGLYSNAGLTLTNSTISRNTSDGRGGGLYSNADLKLVNSAIDSNDSRRSGGGLYVSGMNLEVILEESRVRNNEVMQRSNYGGGLATVGDSTKITLKHSVISENAVGLQGPSGLSYGGGLYVGGDGISLTMTGSTVEGNALGLQSSGGGFYIIGEGAKITLTESEVSSNTVRWHGGGMYIESRDASLTLTNSWFVGNLAEERQGGGLHMRGNDTQVTVSDCTFGENISGGDGGGMYVNGTRLTTTLTNVALRGNNASRGGGLFVFGSDATLTGEYNILSGNAAENEGGGLHHDGNGPIELSRSTITANSAAYGGGLYSAGVATVANSILWENTADIGAQVLGADGAEVAVRYSNVQGGIWAGVTDEGGNIDANPLFVDAPNGDFNLSEGSPSIGTGEDGIDMGAIPFGEDWPIVSIIDAAPVQFSLLQNVPNPFNPLTTLRFSFAEAGAVRLTIYDVTGREVRTLVNGALPAGYHATVWDARDNVGRAVASGVYVYRLTTGENVATRRMVLAR